jgi:GNAT superfamily N-acetyltransferase
MNQLPSPVIRQATAYDADLLAELGARTFSETFAPDNRTEDMAAYLAQSFSASLQSAELAEPKSIFLIAEIKGIAAGYAKLKPGDPPDRATDDNPIELVRLYVSQEWHGRGVGAALMKACIEEAKKKGHRTLWLGVWEHNFRALAFYGKWNFREVGSQIFQLGNCAQTDILMECSLDG